MQSLVPELTNLVDESLRAGVAKLDKEFIVKTQTVFFFFCNLIYFVFGGYFCPLNFVKLKGIMKLYFMPFQRPSDIKFQTMKQFGHAQNKQAESDEKNYDSTNQNRLTYLKVEGKNTF